MVMKKSSQIGMNIRLRSQPHDRQMIDIAAKLRGVSRSQFILAAALQEAKNVALDQTVICTDDKTFNKIIAWMDSPATAEETAGMRKLLSAKVPWRRG